MTNSLDPKVVLVSMPWAPVTEPSLALGILHAQLKGAGIRSKVVHANIELLRHVTFETNVMIAEFWALNEFVFTECMSPGMDETQLGTLVERCMVHMEGKGSDHTRYKDLHAMAEMLLRFRDSVAPGYLDDCADKILAEEPTLVGLTCLFDQALASVALAKRIKDRSPGTMIALGGYALQGAPGEQVLKAFPWIDCIARGDGEPVIEAIARASVGVGALRDIPGLLVRDAVPIPAVKIDLDESPNPDYEDWFREIAALAVDASITIRSDTLPVESSRGCWWGQNKHCVFCGIDEDTLKFRHKSSDRALAMLAGMRESYGDFQFRFSDYILPKPYYDELLPRLAEVEPKYTLKCEIKANQSPERVARLAAAGFCEVQPGIESFSSQVLRVMDKGVSGIQNVALLKYGYRERIVVHYNFLYGIPGEQAGEYRQMLKDVPRIYHLFPPVSRTEAIVTRFAPLHTTPGRFGSNAVPRHHHCYDVLFSEAVLAETGFSLDDYAYYFERYLEYEPEMQCLYSQSVTQINHWKKRHREDQVYLAYQREEGALRFDDSRFGRPRTITLSRVESETYLACDQMPTPYSKVVADVGVTMNCSEDEVKQAVKRLDEERLLWRDGQHVLGLGLPWEVVKPHLESNWKKGWTSIYF